MQRFVTTAAAMWLVATAALAQPEDPAESAETTATPTAEEARAAALAHLRFGLEELARLQAEDEARLDELAGGGAVGEGTAARDDAEVHALAERVAALEAQQAELSQGVDEGMTARQELEQSIFDELARRVTLSGYSTTYFRSTNKRRASFRAFRFNLLVDARVSERLRFFGEMEMEDAARVGEGAGALEVEQAFFELTVGQALIGRAGVLLIPFGYYNQLHEGWRFAFTARPIVNEWIFPSTYADVGVSLSGTLYRGEQNQLRYDLAVVNGLTDGIATELGGKGLRDARPAFNLDQNSSPSVVGNVRLLISDVLELGASGYYGRYAQQGHAALAMAGADALIHAGKLTLRGEGMYVWVQPGGREVDTDGDPTTPDVLMPFPGHLYGGVVEAELRFWFDALSDTFLGDFDDPSLFVAARFEGANLGWDDAQRELSVSGSVGYHPVHRSAVRVEYARGFGDFALKDGWQVTLAFAMGY